MKQSSKLRFFKGEQKNVQGWLMNVRTFRHPKDTVDSVPIETPQRHRKGSFASEDSVNLDELINANFTTDMDDETALPELGDLELDDSTDDFWKLEKSVVLDTSFKTLDWSPLENNANNLKTSLPVTPSSNRSGSISSENSQPQYAKYGLFSESSSRSVSRQSNYSTASSTSILPTPSRSKTIGSTTRASHIPTPSPKPKRSTSTSINTTTTTTTTTVTSPKRSPQRASHIPTLSPLQQQSRIRNSIFPPKKQEKPSGSRPSGVRSQSRIGTLKRTL